MAEKAAETASEMTAAQAAKKVGVKPDDVLDFRDYGTYVVVVTVDGQKLDSRLPKNAETGEAK